MTGLSDSSELKQAVALLRQMGKSGRMVTGVRRPARPSTPLMPPVVRIPAQPMASAPPQPVSASPGREGAGKRTDFVHRLKTMDGSESKGGRIEEILESMCLRGGFEGAVIADEGGLAVAEYNCPVETEAVAACSSVLGGAMERAGRLLEQQDSNHMSMDINYVDKVVLRQFEMEEEKYYLLIICPQDVDERSELELSIDRVMKVLARRM